MFKLYQRIQAHYYLFVKQYQKHAGLWVVPPLLKPRLEKEMSSQIGRKVTIEEIKLNPLVLSAITTNLTVYEKDEEPFAEEKEKGHILNFKYLVSDIIYSTL